MPGLTVAARHLPLLVVFGLVNCRANTARLDAADPVAATSQANGDHLVYRAVYADGIEQVLKPSEAKSDISSNLSGLWYCKGTCDVGLRSSTVMGLTTANAAVEGNDLVFELLGANNYMYKNMDDAYTEFAPIDKTERGVYRVKFTSKTHADIELSYFQPDGSLKPDDPDTYKYSMDLVKPGEWARHSAERKSKAEPWVQYPDYRLIQIADANGERTQEYQDIYQADLAKSGLEKVFVVVDEKGPLGQPGSDIPVKGGRSLPKDTAADSPDSGDGASKATVSDSGKAGGADASSGKR